MDGNCGPDVMLIMPQRKWIMPDRPNVPKHPFHHHSLAADTEIQISNSCIFQCASILWSLNTCVTIVSELSIKLVGKSQLRLPPPVYNLFAGLLLKILYSLRTASLKGSNQQGMLVNVSLGCNMFLVTNVIWEPAEENHERQVKINLYIAVPWLSVN